MTSAQWRVLGILAAILGIEIVTSPTTRKYLVDVATWKPGQASDIVRQSAPAALGFGLGALALIAIAAWQEGMATGIAVLFLVIVLINRSDAIAPGIAAASEQVKNLTGQNGNNGKQGSGQ